MQPTGANDASETRRTWPTTAMLVAVAILLMLVNGFGAGIQAASFFGESASRDDYISAGMECLTTLPAFAGLIWCGWQRGCRVGLWLVAVPAMVMVLAGLNLLATTGGSRDPDPSRAPGPGDLFGVLTLFNWGATVVFVGAAAATHLLRRRGGHTEKGSAA
jgi:hypothetical protein